MFSPLLHQWRRLPSPLPCAIVHFSCAAYPLLEFSCCALCPLLYPLVLSCSVSCIVPAWKCTLSVPVACDYLLCCPLCHLGGAAVGRKGGGTSFLNLTPACALCLQWEEEKKVMPFTHLSLQPDAWEAGDHCLCLLSLHTLHTHTSHTLSVDCTWEDLLLSVSASVCLCFSLSADACMPAALRHCCL